jgi:hypothetical protein
MKKVLVAAFAVAALAVAPSAFAANSATISVTHDKMVLAGSKSTTIHITMPQANDPIAAINIFVPTGYTLNLSQAAGTTIGTVEAAAFSHTTNLTLPLSGPVVVGNPSQFTAQSTQCAGTPTSQAVWILQLSVAGQQINLPVYINPTAGPQTALGAYRITVCLPPYDIPEAQGGAAQGAQVLDVKFTINGVYTTPSTAQSYVWDALFTPYTPKTGKSNPAGTFQARAIEGLPVILSITVKYVKKTNTWQLAGKLTEGGKGVNGVTIRLARGLAANRLTVRSSTKTGATGAWKTAGHLKPNKTTYFRANTSVGERADATGCTGANTTFAPAGCVSATKSPWSVTSAVVRVKR